MNPLTSNTRKILPVPATTDEFVPSYDLTFGGNNVMGDFMGKLDEVTYDIRCQNDQMEFSPANWEEANQADFFAMICSIISIIMDKESVNDTSLTKHIVFPTRNNSNLGVHVVGMDSVTRIKPLVLTIRIGFKVSPVDWQVKTVGGTGKTRGMYLASYSVGAHEEE